ncbi:MAG: recombinase family protein [Clostridia bacterium]|nr:recombinase family protein [Clostridia bacterium]
MTIFLYIRLSSADDDLKFKSESESISNQRKLLHKYITDHPDLAGAVVEEFVDDGYSGTNGDRPAFEHMIERVKNSEADVIICKDFSRFFRDYVEIGDYLERIFPFLGVRFISVNDGYDSDDYKGTTAGMEVVMKYIVYSSYSRDLSQKVRTVFCAKKNKGQWIGSEAPYGYMKDPNNKNKLVINPDTAPVVRLIFDLALAGKKTLEIAKILNNDGIETPAKHYKRTHPDSTKFANASSHSCWGTPSIRRILQTKIYTGAMVSNTKKWKSIYNKHTVKNDESEWIVVPNCHEAIVTNEEFEKAKSTIRKITEERVCAPVEYLLRSLVICGICGRAMARYPYSKRIYYLCTRSAANESTDCPVGEKFYEDDIENAVVTDLREKLQTFVDNQRQLMNAEAATHGTESNIRACIAQTERQLKQKSYERKSAYEKYVDDLISRDDYITIKAKLFDEEEKLKDELAQYENELNTVLSQKNNSSVKLAEKAEDVLSKESFTNEMLLYFIDKVKVYSGNRIEIVYRFQDVFENVPAVK